MSGELENHQDFERSLFANMSIERLVTKAMETENLELLVKYGEIARFKLVRATQPSQVERILSAIQLINLQRADVQFAIESAIRAKIDEEEHIEFTIQAMEDDMNRPPTTDEYNDAIARVALFKS